MHAGADHNELETYNFQTHRVTMCTVQRVAPCVLLPGKADHWVRCTAQSIIGAVVTLNSSDFGCKTGLGNAGYCLSTCWILLNICGIASGWPQSKHTMLHNRVAGNKLLQEAAQIARHQSIRMVQNRSIPS